jgi:NAD(P)-dependent dehydrogenase (short-subunit alcohol dehydrogenase family)
MDVSAEAWDKNMDVNLKDYFPCAQKAAAVLRQKNKGASSTLLRGGIRVSPG